MHFSLTYIADYCSGLEYTLITAWPQASSTLLRSVAIDGLNFAMAYLRIRRIFLRSYASKAMTNSLAEADL